jgi:hypothetical protein
MTGTKSSVTFDLVTLKDDRVIYTQELLKALKEAPNAK